MSLVSESDEEMTLVKFSENTLKSKNRVIVKSTYRSYNQTLNLLKLFEEQNGFQLKFENMTAQFYRQFLNMLEDEDFNVNSMGKHIKNLKIFLNEAVSEGLMTNISYKKQFKILKKQTTQIYLNQEEIELLRDKDFSKQPKLEQARDLFLIGYYTGQRVSDYNGLNQNNIIKGEDGHSIKLKQQKTGYIFEMPLIKKIRDVMERHNNNFPDKMSEPVFRENLKTVARQTGLTKMIKVKSYEGRTEKAEEIPQYKLVKPHTARRSFCTNHYMARKPIQFIMAFSGHKTEKEFMNYIRVEQKVKIKTIVESGFFD